VTADVSGEVHLREAGDHDLDRVVALLEAGSLEEGTEDPADLAPYRAALAEIRSAPGSTVLVAEVGGIVVGVCQVIVVRHVQRRGGRCAELESMHVDPEWRGRGVGGVLLEGAIAHARGLGCYRIQLTSNVARTDAHRFYERHGFVASHVGFKRVLA
jgi:GNAT superfamily N-acetyltransferase